MFGNELMTGYLSPTMPLSRITVGALQDLGYSVNYAKADPYKLPTFSGIASGLSSSNGLSTRLVDAPLTPGMSVAGTSTATVSSSTSTGAGTTSGSTVSSTTQQDTATRPATGTRQFVVVRPGQAPVTVTTSTTARPNVLSGFSGYTG